MNAFIYIPFHSIDFSWDELRPEWSSGVNDNEETFEGVEGLAGTGTVPGTFVAKLISKRALPIKTPTNSMGCPTLP